MMAPAAATAAASTTPVTAANTRRRAPRGGNARPLPSCSAGGLVVAEKINDSCRFGLCNNVRPYALAHKLKRSSELDSALLPVAASGAVINAGRQAVHLSVGERGRLSDVVAAAPETSVVFGEKLQKPNRRVVHGPDPFLS